MLLIWMSVFALIFSHLTKRTKIKIKKNKQNAFYKKLLNYSLGERIQSFLKEAEFSYDTYMAMLTVLMGAVFLCLLLYGWQMALRIFLLFFIPLNTVIVYRRDRYRKLIQLELCNIQDIFYFQSRIGTSLDVILAYVCKVVNPPLKESFQVLNDKFKIYRNINKALEEFRKLTDIMEFQAFTFILEQRDRTGFSEENHQAQASMLKRSKRMSRRIQREFKRFKLILASILLFACFLLMAIVPLMQTVLESINIILR